jgi:hypothetical protein
MFCAFLLFSLAPALWKVLLVRRKFAVLYSRFKLECDHSKSMLLLTRISRAFESHVMLMLGTTFQQPEETLNTCLRKAHQTVLRNSTTHNHKGGGATSEAYFSSSQHRFFGH